VQDLSLLHGVDTDSEDHPVVYPKGIEILFPRVKWQERETEPSPPSSAEVKKVGSYTCTSTPPYAFMA
jgi:hypothetical protein